MTQETETEIPRVLKLQGDSTADELATADQLSSTADEAIARAERIIQRRNQPLPARPGLSTTSATLLPAARPWDELVAEAKALEPGEMSISDVLSADDAESLRARLDGWGAEFVALHKLETYDYVVAGVAGLLAGLADVFLVQVPSHPGFLGGPASEGGWLHNVVKDGFGKLLPPDKIAALEKAYKVSYDACTNSKLSKTVAGLGPRSHRLTSLGHDPILGWIFGVRDILTGQFTAIGKDGRIVVQSVAGFEPAELGLHIFKELIAAFRSVGGHMVSDIATSAGLPPPLFSLLQFLQVGDIKGRTVAEISRIMYRQGYDFRHFLAGGVCVASAETIVRLAWLVRELQEGKDLAEALPVGNKPRLQTKLFLAHSVAAAVNAGKVAVTQNPLSVSWSQWLAFFRYILPQLHWMVVGKEQERYAFLQGKLDEQWKEIEFAFAADFRVAAIDQAVL
jgi:hypothetical protein